ncbi:MAG: alanine racemase [Pseudomonadota bacterium]
MTFDELSTPCLLLDRERLDRNLARMAATTQAAGVRLRPHLKTAKAAAIAARLTDDHQRGITVSTLREAEYFADHGATDIVYAVGIAPARLDQAAALLARGVDLKLLLDTVAAAQAVAAHGAPFQVLIEVDCGDHRGGVAPDSALLVAIAAVLSGSAATLRGVLTHAGHAYRVTGADALAAVAEDERRAVVTAAERLRGAGAAVDFVSGGSTPSALVRRCSDGLTELRAGVYMFFDLDQQSRGVCRREEIALSVLATVIGHNEAARKVLLDAGGLALSKDTGATVFRPEVGYGEVCDVRSCRPLPGLYVQSVSQEHGHVPLGPKHDFAALPVGSRVRVLPNHACMTAAAYDAYEVVEGDRVVERWSRVNGW